jgi:glycosyltransferase involved in cell wall biosynthesis
MAEELVTLRPSAIHANDADGLAAAVAAADRLEPTGRRPVVIYDAHEWTEGREDYLTPPPGVRSELELERRSIHRANAVITVSEPLSAWLERTYALSQRPAVVHSAPPAADRLRSGELRRPAGVPKGCRLLAYAGRIAERRGVDDAVRALRSLPDEVHLVLIGEISRGPARKVSGLAAAEGVAERVHVLDAVPPDRVVATLRDADIGLLPLRFNRQHEIAMPNKLFQYAQAGLPIVASDFGEIGKFVRELEIGEVFAPGDPESLAQAVGRALSNRDAIAERLAGPAVRERTSWEAQEPVLIDLYRRLGALPVTRV